MTSEQIELVQTSFQQKIWPEANEAARLFYEHLFVLDPTLPPLFNLDLSEQWRKLMEMLWVVVHGLNEPEDLEPLLESLGQRHADYGVKPEYYQTMEKALLWMVQTYLQNEFTTEAETAWRSVYRLMATTMQEAADAN